MYIIYIESYIYLLYYKYLKVYEINSKILKMHFI